jgi:L-threonylcarbamoyladenylate synthase
LDAGPAPGGEPSTIVDVSDAVPRLIRAGAIAWDEISACLQQHA